MLLKFVFDTLSNTYKFCQETPNAHMPNSTFNTNGNFLPTLLLMASNQTVLSPPFATAAAPTQVFFQALPFKYNIPYTTGQAIFSNANMEAFSPCNRPWGTPNSDASDVMAALVPSFCTPANIPRHAAARTCR
jgi:hypothetical protein